MIVEHASITDKGLVRPDNQDSILCLRSWGRGLFVVADGMGGHSHGEIASSTVTGRLRSWWSGTSGKEIDELARECADEIRKAGSELYEMFSSRGEIGGTTVSAAMIVRERIAILNIGDSRVYSFNNRRGQFERETTDDVWENQASVRGSMTVEQIRADRRYGRLTQAVGAMADVNISVRIVEHGRPGALLIVSDGIYRFISESDMSSFYLRDDKKCEQTVYDIAATVVENGAADNYSAILVRLR